MKIAIASSGLGHVARGIETWALDSAVALAEAAAAPVRSGQFAVSSKEAVVHSPLEVTLFCAAPLATGGVGTSNPNLQGAGMSSLSALRIRVLPCLKRGDRLTRWIVKMAPGFTWRWGWTSPYDLEQRSFWRWLYPILRDEGYDILHVQDPLLADLCRRYREVGKLKTKEILAHGTEEPLEFLARFPYVQHLAPWHLEQALVSMDEAGKLTTKFTKDTKREGHEGGRGDGAWRQP